MTLSIVSLTGAWEGYVLATLGDPAAYFAGRPDVTRAPGEPVTRALDVATARRLFAWTGGDYWLSRIHGSRGSGDSGELAALISEMLRGYSPAQSSECDGDFDF